MTRAEAMPPQSRETATRFRLWRAGLGLRPAEFAMPPEPRSIGSAAIGRAICLGEIQLGGRRRALDPETSLWDLRPLPPRADLDRHGFAWLDDLAAAGTSRAQAQARRWLADWLARYDSGSGPGWRADIAARRLVRWINHAEMLAAGVPEAEAQRFRRSIARHAVFVAQGWRGAPRGLPTFEAVCGLVQAGLALRGMDARIRPAVKVLERLCREEIGEDGGLPGRNPEELLELFCLLVWCDSALADAGLAAQPQHQAAIARIAPVLRALRHADGGLARFHGGGRGLEGRLDAALAASRVRSGPPEGLAMGFARLARGRATVILDAARPPQGAAAAATGHASTLAFELTAGRRPIVVNCGSGLSFGRDWELAARATPAHSALTPDGEGSSVLRELRQGRTVLAAGPREVDCGPVPGHGPASLSASHDGFAARHGLIHQRQLDLGEDGMSLHGEDSLLPLDGAELDEEGTGFTIRFHLHPDVAAQQGEDGLSVTLLLKSGEVWQFRHASPARMSLDPSVYLEKTRPQPTPTRQIVLDARAAGSGATIRWSLSRVSQGTDGTRDLYRDDMSIT
ncbi:heparinase II/III family protein [Poseidonocella sp. HB161398]|uniref:heparinase II/III family protein n=1 Tax=Poseidonocella sp. HB161398 TaxID=2320855 RepID=UPI00148618C2|nr:heparinase II/III family protein [Poseidonocella sp. HB161398]